MNIGLSIPRQNARKRTTLPNLALKPGSRTDLGGTVTTRQGQDRRYRRSR